MAIILKNAPKTEEGRKLNLTKEQEEQYKIVFRFDANKKELVNIEDRRDGSDEHFFK